MLRLVWECQALNVAWTAQKLKKSPFWRKRMSPISECCAAAMLSNCFNRKSGHYTVARPQTTSSPIRCSPKPLGGREKGRGPISSVFGRCPRSSVRRQSEIITDSGAADGTFVHGRVSFMLHFASGMAIRGPAVALFRRKFSSRSPPRN